MPLDDSFFVSDALEARPVTLPDGSVHMLHFREPTSTEVRMYQIAEASEDEAVRANALTVLICASLREPDGRPALTREQAQRLKPRAASALLREIYAMSGMRGDEAKKASPPGEDAGFGTS